MLKVATGQERCLVGSVDPWKVLSFLIFRHFCFGISGFIFFMY